MDIENKVTVTYTAADIRKLLIEDAERTVGSHKAVNCTFRITTVYDKDDWRGEYPRDELQDADVVMEQKK